MLVLHVFFIFLILGSHFCNNFAFFLKWNKESKNKQCLAPRHIVDFTVLVNFNTPPRTQIALPRPKTFWKSEIFFGFSRSKGRKIILLSPLDDPLELKQLTPSKNFEMSSGGGGIKVNKNGNILRCYLPDVFYIQSRINIYPHRAKTKKKVVKNRSFRKIAPNMRKCLTCKDALQIKNILWFTFIN